MARRDTVEKILDTIMKELCISFDPLKIKHCIDRALDRLEDQFKDGSLGDIIVETVLNSLVRKPFDILDDDGDTLAGGV